MQVNFSGASLHQGVLSELRDYIVAGGVPAGARVPERELCERLRVSRTPLREALKVLAAEGLVQLLPHRGAWVRAYSEADMRHLFELVGALEAAASRLACERITQEELLDLRALHMAMYEAYMRRDLPEYVRLNQAIHLAILEAARNPMLLDTYENLSARLRRLRFAADAIAGDGWSRAMREHEEMIVALGDRNGPVLAEIMHRHIRAKCEAVCKSLQTSPGRSLASAGSAG